MTGGASLCSSRPSARPGGRCGQAFEGMEKAMFAIVRTGGKQYRVAAGDKIVVEKLAGEAGDTVTLDDVLLAGDGGDLKSTDGLTVSAEIIAQAKADKVIVFKKKRRHNYRRKRGHRQQHTILRIVAIGDQKAAPKKAEKPAKPVAAKPVLSDAAGGVEGAAAEAKPAKAAKPVQSDAAGGDEAAEAAPKVEEAKPAKAEAKKPAAKAKAEAPVKSEPTAGEIDTSKKKASTKKPAAGKNA
ncbi:MAG: 50S ribosomal protein L21 [Allosphingosinicella sp.]